MAKKTMTAAGIVTGMMMVGAAGLLMTNNKKVKARRITRKAAKALDTVGDMLHNVANMAN